MLVTAEPWAIATAGMRVGTIVTATAGTRVGTLTKANISKRQDNKEGSVGGRGGRRNVKDKGTAEAGKGHHQADQNVALLAHVTSNKLVKLPTTDVSIK